MPAWFYRAYDLSPLLQRGENVFGVEVGHGWYGAKKVLVQIYVDYADGETEEYHSSVNGGWWVAGSPTLDNSVYDGEVYDARLEDKIPRNWASAEYRPAWENGWMFTIYAAPPSGKLQAERMEPIRVTGIFEAASLTDKGDGVKIADIGRNIAGWARIRVRGQARGARHFEIRRTAYRRRVCQQMQSEKRPSQRHLRPQRRGRRGIWRRALPITGFSIFR